jgi:sigma-54 dependent transcriptional regulator, acetoin dehydrogenase operon transcriptional activator AcoR
VDDVVRHAGSGLAVLVTGEAGTGKLTVARAVHDHSGEATSTVLDAASSFIEGVATWLGQVREVLAGPGTVVLRHLQLLDAGGAAGLSSLLDGEEQGPSARVVGTMTPDGGPDPGRLRPLIDRFPVTIEVPPLRSRPEDVTPLVGCFLERHARDRSTRCRPDVIELLARGPWPGNVRQLENVVRALVARRPTGDIVVADLPPELRRAAGPGLSGLQQMERDAIVAALTGADGNRVEAAAALGISRSTLYRKLHAYGLEPTV